MAPSVSRVLISGASGLIGTALSEALTAQGHQIVRLVRGRDARGTDEIAWNPDKWKIESEKIKGITAVVHLAGENIAEGRWNEQKKAQIRDSRLIGTALLARGLAEASDKPKLLISGSAVGIYGNRGEESLNERSAGGQAQPGFLPGIAEEWEAATEKAQVAGIRVVHLRTGVVLTKRGGALSKMLLPFKLGLGGPLGTGAQYMSWISLHDLLRAIQFILKNETLRGPVNAVAPNPVTNTEFTKTLGQVLNRPTFLRAPKALLQLLLGEMADEVLLSSARVYPTVLTQAGFTFAHAYLEEALRFALTTEQ